MSAGIRTWVQTAGRVRGNRHWIAVRRLRVGGQVDRRECRAGGGHSLRAAAAGGEKKAQQAGHVRRKRPQREVLVRARSARNDMGVAVAFLRDSAREAIVRPSGVTSRQTLCRCKTAGGSAGGNAVAVAARAGEAQEATMVARSSLLESSQVTL